jgi:hypothetical protein
MPKKKPTLEELIARYKPDTSAPAREIMEHLYEAVLATPEFTLKDGTKAKVEKYVPPEMSDDGELSCGIDVVLDNGTRLEFSMKNTGWGKSFAPAHAPPKSKRDRQR